MERPLGFYLRCPMARHFRRTTTTTPTIFLIWPNTLPTTTERFAATSGFRKRIAWLAVGTGIPRPGEGPAYTTHPIGLQRRRSSALRLHRGGNPRLQSLSCQHPASGISAIGPLYAPVFNNNPATHLTTITVPGSPATQHSKSVLCRGGLQAEAPLAETETQRIA